VISAFLRLGTRPPAFRRSPLPIDRFTQSWTGDRGRAEQRANAGMLSVGGAFEKIVCNAGGGAFGPDALMTSPIDHPFPSDCGERLKESDASSM